MHTPIIIVLAASLTITAVSPIAGKEKPSWKPIRDGKISIEGTVGSLVDFEREQSFALISASLGHRQEYVSFGIMGPSNIYYICEVRTHEYPSTLEIGDKVKVEGDAMHTEAGKFTIHSIKHCKIRDRQPGPAEHVLIEGLIAEHADFPGRPSSASFKVLDAKKTYSCFIKEALAEFREYRVGDKISVTGVVLQPGTLTVERCRVLSHSAVGR